MYIMCTPMKRVRNRQQMMNRFRHLNDYALRRYENVKIRFRENFFFITVLHYIRLIFNT